MVETEVIETLKKFKQALIEQGINVTKIILYGSNITESIKKDSDIDVAIVSPDFGKDRFEEGVMLFQLACKIDPRIEPVPISSNSFENDTWVPLIYEIRSKGVELETIA